ncbi:MAG: hypothetical protein M1814_002896 [Vezdaea aestivalis]|nr:MAG: hypothetical protein M1814_002896 [Vezdaea aestivalis]
MANVYKRKANTSPEMPSKRSKTNSKAPPPFASVNAPVDPSTGQRMAFPGLDDDGMFYGPASNGLDYLRMVRSQAKLVPSLLTAIKPSDSIEAESLRSTHPNPRPEGLNYDDTLPYDEEDDGDDITGECEDDAEQSGDASTARSAPTAQSAYHTSLLSRFHSLRARMRAPSLAQAPPPVPSKPRWLQWRHNLCYTQPTLSTLANMTTEDTLFALGVLSRYYMAKRKEIGSITGAWAWVLLARLDDVGTMQTSTVGRVREIGKKAVQTVKAMRRAEHEYGDEDDEDWGDGRDLEGDCENEQEESNGDGGAKIAEDVRNGLFANAQAAEGPRAGAEEMTAQADQGDLGNPDTGAGGAQSLESARESLLRRMNEGDALEVIQSSDEEGEVEEETPWPSTLMTLDLIITVIGEVYGQRDLLEGRMAWP